MLPLAVTVGVEGKAFTATGKPGDVVPFVHELDPLTVIVPELAAEEKSTAMAFVFAPDVTLAPAGSVQM